jgi:hypothetical protein
MESRPSQNWHSQLYVETSIYIDFFHIIIIFNVSMTFMLLPIDGHLSMVAKDANPRAYEHDHDHEQH